MRGLYLRGKKWYCSIVSPITKKLVRKPLSEDRQTALAILSQMKRDFDFARAGIATKVSHVKKARPAHDIIREYMDHMTTLGRGPSFSNDLNKAWRVVFKPAGIAFLEQCSQERIESWIRDRLLAGTKPQTINHYLSTLRGLFAWAESMGYSTGNLLAKWRQLKPTEKRYRRDLTNDEIRSILMAESDPEWKIRWLVYLYTGLRSSAGAAIEWDWIDWDREVITLPSRNNKSRRTHRIPMHHRLHETLRQWQRETGKTAGPIFPRVHPSTILFRFKSTCRKGCIDLRGICIHSLRHTVATRVYEASGNNLKAAQEILGHTNIGTTAAYLHVDDAVKRAAVAGLNFEDADKGA